MVSGCILLAALKRCFFSGDTCFKIGRPFEDRSARPHECLAGGLERGYCCVLLTMSLLTADRGKLRSSWSFISLQ